MTSASLIALLAVTAGCAGSSESSLSPPRAPLTNVSTEPITVVTRAASPRQKTGDPPTGTCYVDFLDIGTGLAVLIRCKDSSDRVLNIVYDGGSNDANLRAKDRLVYLLDTGLGFKPGSTIHHLFHSHPHYDHHSELIRPGGVLAQYDVKNVWDPAAINDTSAYGCFITGVIDKANATNLVYHPARVCPDFSALRCDGAAIPAWRTPATSVKPFEAPSRSTPAVAAPAINFGFTGITGRILHADPTAKDPNDASLVLKLELFGVKVLLTGDEEAGRYAAADTAPADKSVEKFLIDSGADLSANIVQIPHHGSESSSSNQLQNATKLKYREKSDTFAVIASGLKEYRGGKQLPTPRIVESWKRKIGRDHVLSTKLNDVNAPLCVRNPDKIAPAPATDETTAGCNNIEFTIRDKAVGRKITSVVYWPIGPDVSL
jgi:beta-lactamase superfamily II metal-dependent hydrolase